MARAVIAVPHQYTWDTRKQSSCHHERHAVLHFGVVAYRYYGVSDDCDWKHEQHDDATKSQPVGNDGDDDCEDGSDGVRDDGPKLSFVRVRGEVEIVDDGWEKQAKRIKAAENGEVTGCREPDLQVEYSAVNFGPREFLIVVGAELY